MAPKKMSKKAVEAPMMKKAMKDAKKKMGILGKWKGPSSTSTSTISASTSAGSAPPTPPMGTNTVPVQSDTAPVHPAKPTRRPARRDLHKLPKFLEVPSDELLAQLMKGSRHHLMVKHYSAQRK